VIAASAGVALLYFGRDFFITLLVSALIAFILDPAVLLVMKLRLPRGAATPIVIGIAFALLYLAGVLLWTQVATLSEDLPSYTSRLNELIEKANTRLDEVEQQTIEKVVPKTLREQEQQIQEKPREAMRARRRRSGSGTVSTPAIATVPVIQEVTIHQPPKPVIATLYAYLSHYFHLMIMASFVPFLVYFMLSWHDRLGQTLLTLVRGPTLSSLERAPLERAWTGIGDGTRAFVLGNFFLWLFMSSASAIIFFFLGVPYWPLVGPLSAAFSLVPYAGLALSVLPPVLAAIAIPNKFKIIVLIVVLTAALHVFAMNFLYAKIVGRRVRLNPLAVTIALMFWGVIWGGAGLLLAVPITAAIKSVCDNVESLNGYGRLLGD
jgi:predicted PurR-regulated permease PerM